MEAIYSDSAAIFIKCAKKYGKTTGRVMNTLFKNRGFDNEYIIPAIKIFLKKLT